MLPLVLGGIALAAVGYGVKEYCESEGCFCDGEVTLKSSPSSEEIFDTIEQNKRLLHEALLKRLKTALVSVAPKKEEKLSVLEEVHYEHFSSTKMPEDVKLYAKQYASLIDKALVEVHLTSQNLSVLKEKDTPYKQLSKEEKQQVKEAVKLFNLTCEILALRLLDKEALNIESIAPLKRVQTQLDAVTTIREA